MNWDHGWQVGQQGEPAPQSMATDAARKYGQEEVIDFLKMKPGEKFRKAG